MIGWLRALVAVLLLVPPATAFGHAEMNQTAGFGEWLRHYLVAPDHVFALIALCALGLLARALARRRHRRASNSRLPRAPRSD